MHTARAHNARATPLFYTRLEAKLDMMLKLQEESKNARRPSGELFNVRGRRGDPVARGEERAPAAPPPMIQPGPFRDNANGLLPSHPPAKGVPPGGTRSLEDMYPIPSSIGCRYVVCATSMYVLLQVCKCATSMCVCYGQGCVLRVVCICATSMNMCYEHVCVLRVVSL